MPWTKKAVDEKVEKAVKKTVSAVKKVEKAVSDFKKKHPILTGAIIIGSAAVLTVVTEGAGAGALAVALSTAYSGALTGSVIGAVAGATFGFVSGLIETKSLKGALDSAAQGFGSGAASGAVSGAFSGVAATTDKVSSLVKVLRSNTGQSATNTLGEIAGSITDRAINGEKITAEDVAFDLVLNRSFKAGPKVLNKLKNSKPVQAVEYGLLKLKSKAPEVNSKIISAAKSKASVAKDKFISGASNAKAKVASTVSGLKESVGNKLSGAGGKAVSGHSAVNSEEIEANFILFNKTHKDSIPKPKGTGPNGGKLQSHHGLQKEWAKANLSQYGYDERLAPTVTIETGKAGPHPHTIITNAQNARRDARLLNGKEKWSTSLQDELSNIVLDFRSAGFSESTIDKVLQQQYDMLEKLNVPYERIMH